MPFKKKILYLPLLIFTVIIFIKPVKLSAQVENNQDTIIFKKHSPQKATLYSTVLPGLGQAYNKKYWKIPIIYVGFGVLTYFIISNRKEYIKYNDAFNFVPEGNDTIPPNDYWYKYDESQLSAGRNYYRRNMEFSCILAGLWYILNIVDAAVDAHLFDYDISDDLSIKFQPIINNSIFNPQPTPGLMLTFKF